MMSSSNRDDSIKCHKEGMSYGEETKVARSINASEVNGNASCEVRGGCSTDAGEDIIT